MTDWLFSFVLEKLVFNFLSSQIISNGNVTLHYQQILNTFISE